MAEWKKQLIILLIDSNPALAARSWRDDFPHENGFYQCECCVCHQEFYGHKRRVICKECDERQALGIRDFVIAPQEFGASVLSTSGQYKHG